MRTGSGKAARNAVTTDSSKWVRAQRRSSSTASTGVRDGRYARLVVIASNASTTATIRASTGMSSPPSRSGNPVPSIRS